VLLTLLVTDKRSSSPEAVKPSPGASSAKGRVQAKSRTTQVGVPLNRLVAQKRSLTVDDAARLLNVSPRRVSRLLDNGTLIVVPAQDGTRRVSAVSVHDFLARQPTAQEGEPVPSAAKVVKEEETEEGEEEDGADDEEELVPGPTQKYWYYAEGDSRSYRSLREVLQAIGLPYAATAWAELPASARVKLRRERIEQGGNSE
jgi:Helix-turn-helix domain